MSKRVGTESEPYHRAPYLSVSTELHITPGTGLVPPSADSGSLERYLPLIDWVNNRLVGCDWWKWNFTHYNENQPLTPHNVLLIVRTCLCNVLHIRHMH